MATCSSILAWKIPWTEEWVWQATVHGVTKSRTQLTAWYRPRWVHLLHTQARPSVFTGGHWRNRFQRMTSILLRVKSIGTLCSSPLKHIFREELRHQRWKCMTFLWEDTAHNHRMTDNQSLRIFISFFKGGLDSTPTLEMPYTEAEHTVADSNENTRT